VSASIKSGFQVITLDKPRPPISTGYKGKRTLLRIDVDLSQGWGKGPKPERLYFNRTGVSIPYKDDVSFRCDIWLSYPEAQQGKMNELLPTAAFGEFEEGSWRMSLEETLLSITLPTSSDFWARQEKTEHGWLKCSHETTFNLLGRTSNPFVGALEWKSEPLVSASSKGPGIWMRVTVYRLGGPPMLHPEDRQRFEDKSVVSGGRPESNRRKF